MTGQATRRTGNHHASADWFERIPGAPVQFTEAFMKRAWRILLVFTFTLPTATVFRHVHAAESGKATVRTAPTPAPLSVTATPTTSPGTDIEEDSTPLGVPPRDFSYLPESKRTAVRLAECEVGEESIRNNSSGKLGILTIKDTAKHQRDLDQHLNRILTPEEKFEYDVRDSVFAQMLTSSIYALTATDAEFRAIYKHRREFEDRIATNSADVVTAWADCDQQIRQSIGDKRFQKYQMIQEPDYRAIIQFFRSEGLDEELELDLYHVYSGANTDANKVRQNDSLTFEAKQQRLKQIASDAKGDMLELLGTGPDSEKFKVRGYELLSRIESFRTRSRAEPESLINRSTPSQPGPVSAAR